MNILGKVCRISAVTLGITTLASCASVMVDLPSHNELLSEMTGQDGRTCIRQSDIRGYGVLDDDVISIDVSRNKYYLATTVLRCGSLQTGFKTGFDGTFAQFCGGGRDKVVTLDESCPIQGIFEFESREAAFDAFEMSEVKRRELMDEAVSTNTQTAGGNAPQ